MPCTLSTTDEKIWHIAPMSEGFSRLEERKYLWKWGDKRLGRGQVQETKMTQSRTHCTHLLGIAFHKKSNFKWDISIFYKIFLYWFYNVLYERCVCVCVTQMCLTCPVVTGEADTPACEHCHGGKAAFTQQAGVSGVPPTRPKLCLLQYEESWHQLKI